MRILIIKAMADSHPYSVFARALASALDELGHAAAVSDQEPYVANGAAETRPLLAELQASRYDAVLSFSSYFGGLAVGGGPSLFDALGVKFVGWQLDHPIYAPQSLAPVLRNRFAVYPNRNHLRYAQAVKLPGRGTVMLPGGDPPARPPKDHSARPTAILVAATYRGEPQRLWEGLEDSPGKRLLTGVIDRLLKDREASLLDAFNETSAKLRLGARLGQDPAFDAQMRNFLCEPLTYVRNLDRIAIIRALVEAGLPVTICGGGWEALLGRPANVTYLPPAPFEDMPALYAEARVAINLNAGNGGSERAVAAALAGAAVVSDYSQQLDAEFGGGDGIAFFNRARPETAASVAAGLLESGRGEAVAARGQARMAAAGLWRHRAAELVRFVEAGPSGCAAR
jgi:hypothetical protein